MSRALVVAVAGLLGCTGLPEVHPASVPALDPPHLGEKLEQLPRTGELAARLVALRGGGALLATVVTRRWDDELRPAVNDVTPRWRVVSPDGAQRDVDPPPDNRLGELFAGAAPQSAWLALDRKRFHFVDGAWAAATDLPTPVKLLVEGATGQLFARGQDGSTWATSGATWANVSTLLALPAGTPTIFGPADARAFHVVSLEATPTGERMCDRLVEWQGLSVGTPRCRDRTGMSLPVSFASDSFSGAMNDFPVLLGNELWRFHDDAWERGFINFVPTTVARFLPLPGRPDALLANAEPWQLSNVERWSAGAMTGLHVALEWPDFSCDRVIDGGPFDCEQRLVSQLASVSPDAAALWVLSVNAADTYPTAWLKKLPVPTAPRTCPQACSAEQQCFADSPAGPRCVAHPHDVTPTLGPRSAVVLSVATGESSLAQGTFRVRELSSGAELPVTPSASGLRTLVPLPVRTRVELSVGAPGYAARLFELESPNEGVTADLGTIHLARGLALGEAFQPVEAVALGAGMAVALQRADGGVGVTAVTDLPDGGVQASALFETADPTTRLFGDPTGRYLVARGERALTLFDFPTGGLTSVDAGLAAATRTPQFSRDGTRFAVDTVAGVSVFSVPDLQLVLAAGGGAALVQQSRDGRVLLVKPPSGAPQVVTSAGAVDVPVSDVAEAVLSGDGAQVYTLSPVTKVLAVAPAAAPSSTTVVHDAGLALAVDPDGADLLFAVATSAQLRQVRHYAADGGAVSVVNAHAGVAFSFPRAGALGVQSSGSSSSELYFPARPGPARTVPALPRSVDARGRLHGEAGTRSMVVSEAAEFSMNAKGPGVYRLDGTRKVNAAQLTVSVMVGGSEVRVVPLAAPGAPLTFAAALSQANPMTTVDWPCALFTLPRRQPTVEPTSGAVTWRDVGLELFCFR